ncbi:hypothetical protein GCM10010964_30190 [Caldovatus sediminis]|uniref:Uncharacterized protein n=1 Tax=Caldovatus sediminis TaxID=2041189 RepID=A0A8J2ZD87_9PROT|nr:hypothetical protein [Caldovatus sediminis]GGG40542.1 hypothetical protein GCM10010964_30190 [Caldovatus sediminis]
MPIPAGAPPDGGFAPPRDAAPLPAAAPAATALTLGPFAVGEDGVLAPRAPGQDPPRLRFAWRGRPCEARLDAASELRLAAIAARIPSTAEPDGAARRSAAFAALGAVQRALPGGWRLALTPDHRVRIEARTRLAAPATATGLVAAMVRFALTLDPYLDRLESAGVAGDACG